jgi:hypothetical protein
MEVSGQLHVPAALTPGNNRVKEAGCTSELDRTFWRTQKSLSPAGTRTPELPGHNAVTAVTILTRCYADLFIKTTHGSVNQPTCRKPRMCKACARKPTQKTFRLKAS